MPDFLKKILWVTDFSDESLGALTYANHFARTFDAKLLALHVIPDFSPALYNTSVAIKGELVRRIDTIKQEVKERLDNLKEKKRVSFASIVKEGTAAKKIIQTAEDEKVDLIVMGQRGLSALEKLFIGSVANQVLRNSPVPILLVKKGQEKFPFQKILVPTDFSEYEEIERDFAWKLARGLQAELLFLHVLELHDHEFPPRVLDDMRNALIRKLKARKSREHADVKVAEEVTRAINASVGIVDYVDTHGHDLIVISTCGPSRLERFFLGSTTEKVISHSKVPVFAIPAAECKS